jgi:hypothetical protein
MSDVSAAGVHALRFEPLFVLYLDVAFDKVQALGQTSAGWRGVYPVNGGRFEGPRLRGKVLPGGADWVTRRADGATAIDVRLMLAADDGAAIAMTYTGLLCMSETARRQFRKGEPTDYRETYIRTTPRFETADERYAWLNRVIAVANGGAPGTSDPTYQVFAIL